MMESSFLEVESEGRWRRMDKRGENRRDDNCFMV